MALKVKAVEKNIKFTKSDEVKSEKKKDEI